MKLNTIIANVRHSLPLFCFRCWVGEGESDGGLANLAALWNNYYSPISLHTSSLRLHFVTSLELILCIYKWVNNNKNDKAE